VQGSFDTTGPLGDSGFSYRVIGLMRRGETQVGTVDNKDAIYLYGSYAPKQSSGRSWLRYSYQDIESSHEAANWFYDGAGNPSSFLGAGFLSVPVRPIAYRENHSFEVGHEVQMHGANSAWNLRIVGRYDQNWTEEWAMIPLGYAFYDANGALLGKTSTAVASTQPKFTDNWADIRLDSTTARNAGPGLTKQYGGYVDLAGEFATGPVRHKLLAYSQVSGANSDSKLTNYSMPTGFSFSVINPVYFNHEQFFSNPVLGSSSEGSSEAFNFGVQDNVFLFNDRLILVGGARYDHAVDNGSLNRLTGVRSASRTTNNWVYKGGVVFKPLKEYDGVSLFYNYSETFTAQAGASPITGIPFKDIEGVANEVGFKLELLKQGVVMTASVFENKNTNFPIRVLIPELGLDDLLQIGTGVSKGWEADIAWQPNPQVSFMFAVSDVDSKNPNGLYKRNVQNGANYRFVGKYTFKGGVLDKASAGVAFVTIADRAGDNPNSFVTEGYNTLDLFASYALGKNWRFQANLTNLFDEDGVESSIVSSLAQVQKPRAIRLSAQYTF
jgi:iron complex outermembrane receptor protein